MNGTDKIDIVAKYGSLGLLAIVIEQLARMNGQMDILIRVLMNT